MTLNTPGEERNAAEYLPGAHLHLLTPLYELIASPMLGGVWNSITGDVKKVAQLGATVVDLGCGPATVLRRLARSRPDLNLTGVDIDEQMLSISRRRIPQTRLLRASVDAVPIEKKTIDVVFSSLVFHHLPRKMKQGALREVQRILRPDGVFLLCDFSVPVNRSGRWFAGLFGKFESGVASQASGELLEIAYSESFSVLPIWTRLGCITQYEIRRPLE